MHILFLTRKQRKCLCKLSNKVHIGFITKFATYPYLTLDMAILGCHSNMNKVP
uniref:Uncharacterized protein n=1 Tax=Arundo donax TaxID=35708 RepID=A0A0A9ABA1_ARUDO